LLYSLNSNFRFSANETVRSISLTSSDDHSFTLTTVTRSGSLLCFDHNIVEKPGKSSKKKKPAKPRATVQASFLPKQDVVHDMRK
jgi:hypothetical protein